MIPLEILPDLREFTEASPVASSLPFKMLQISHWSHAQSQHSTAWAESFKAPGVTLSTLTCYTTNESLGTEWSPSPETNSTIHSKSVMSPLHYIAGVQVEKLR